VGPRLASGGIEWFDCTVPLPLMGDWVLLLSPLSPHSSSVQSISLVIINRCLFGNCGDIDDATVPTGDRRH